MLVELLLTLLQVVFEINKHGRAVLVSGMFLIAGPELDPVVLVLEALLACCVTVIVVLIFYVVKIRRRVCEHNKGAFLSCTCTYYAVIYTHVLTLNIFALFVYLCVTYS